MSKSTGFLDKLFRVVLLVIVMVAVVSLIIRNINTFGNILLTIIGFGMVILVHEFGHFLFAKLADIKVEAFSIGFPPILAGVQRTEKGWRIRILPGFFPQEEGSESDGCLLNFTIGKKAKAGETEYRLGLIPFGGFVKMLGQEDTKEVEANDDPRSYANKPVSRRMLVIAAGVVFNAISAVIVFITAFLIGIEQVPAVIGGVMGDSPAAHVGLMAGDEVIEIAGKSSDLNFRDVVIAAALSGRDEAVELKVRRIDGAIAEFSLVPERMNTPLGDMRFFGFLPPASLTVAQVSDANALIKETGLRGGDKIKAVSGRDIESSWQMRQIVKGIFAPEVAVLAQRGDNLVESKIGLDLISSDRTADRESETGHIYSMVPRLRLGYVSAKEDANSEIGLQSGDIILAIGDVNNPTYKEMREITTAYEDKEMPIKLLRIDENGVENIQTITVTPKRSKDDRVVIGIYLVAAFDAAHAVVAKTISVDGMGEKMQLPRGATITAVDGVEVSSFYDVIREIKRNTDQRISIDYRLNEQIAGSVAIDVKEGDSFLGVESTLAESIPFKPLTKLYKATGPIDAMGMGYRRTVTFITEAVITLKRLVGGLISPKNFMGPLGIVTTSYKIVAEKPLIYYAYFLGLISAFIAVLNSLPLLPFDGGHLLFLLIEKIKGSPVSEKVQGVILYIGLAVVGAFFLYVTFNDIVRSFIG